MSSLVLLQIAAETSWPLLETLAMPPTTYCAVLAVSGWQRESRSGRGFPRRFFMLLVMNHADDRESAKPSHPMCSSQSLRFQIRDCGIPPGTVVPGMNTSAMMRMTTIGARVLAMMRI